MKFIVDFYKGLDAVNLLIFWGVIIVVLLLLIFAIIITNKNRKLEKILEKSGIDVDDFNGDGDLAIKKETEENHAEESPKFEPIKHEISKDEVVTYEQKPEEVTETIINEDPTLAMPVIETKEKTTIPEKEDRFVAEEHVMEYQPEIPKEEKVESKEISYEPNIPNKPYQRNVLRDVYPDQTSPIGISTNNDASKSEIYKANELHEVLNEKDAEKEETLLNQKKYADSYSANTRKGDYLEELSKKLSSSSDDIRTAYEIKQEEDAIISYEELMQKKDSIKTIDEEDAIISIDELRKRKQEKEKIYNITKEEENDEFIDELKHFRSDL